MKTFVINSIDSLLPRRGKEALLHLGFHIASDEFQKFAFLYANAPEMRRGMLRLRDRGLAPESIVDAGSFHGDWGRMSREIWPKARLAMIEPNTELTEPLRALAGELNAEFYCELLGPRDGDEVRYHVMGSGSSVYEEHSSLPRRQEVRHTRTLDSVLDGWEEIGLLKIDAQGYELEILKGAERLLPRTSSVLLEIAVIGVNRGAPRLDEVVAFMKERGFVTCDILEIHRRPRDQALIQIDLLFVREDSPLLADTKLL